MLLILLLITVVIAVDNELLCGKRIISGSDDNTVKMWDIETGACIRTLKGHTSAGNAL